MPGLGLVEGGREDEGCGSAGPVPGGVRKRGRRPLDRGLGIQCPLGSGYALGVGLNLFISQGAVAGIHLERYPGALDRPAVVDDEDLQRIEFFHVVRRDVLPIASEVVEATQVGEPVYGRLDRRLLVLEDLAVAWIVGDLRGHAEVGAEVDREVQGIFLYVEERGPHPLAQFFFVLIQRPPDRRYSVGVGQDDKALPAILARDAAVFALETTVRVQDLELYPCSLHGPLPVCHADPERLGQLLAGHGLLTVAAEVEEAGEVRQLREPVAAVVQDGEPVLSGRRDYREGAEAVPDALGWNRGGTRLRVFGVGQRPLDVAGRRARRDQPVVACPV